MAFHDVRLPEEIEQGAQGGPGFKTSIIQLATGFEKRNIDWSLARSRWDIGYAVRKKADYELILAFFYARQGRAHSFRFRDWSDFTIGPAPQEFGIGDASTTVFQVEKRYVSGSTTFGREVTKLVDGTVRVFLDGVEQTSGYTTNLLTGEITFSVAPGGSVSIGAICEFDLAMRFDIDELSLDLQFIEDGAFPSIPIIEVRGE